METDILKTIEKIRSYGYLRSKMPIRRWKNTLDAQQAFLELWWLDQELLMKRFTSVQTIEQQSEQFYSNLNRLGYVVLDIKSQVGRQVDENYNLRTAVDFILDRAMKELQNLDPENESGTTLSDLLHELIEDGILSANDEDVRRQIVCYFIWEKLFYQNFLPKPGDATITPWPEPDNTTSQEDESTSFLSNLPIRNLQTKGEWMQAIYDLAISWGYMQRWPEVLKFSSAEAF